MDLIWTDIVAAWPNIILAWTALFLVALAPGPTVVAIMGISMARGRRAGLIFTAGCMTGATTWAVLAGLGLSVWLTSFASGIIILKIIGGLYLIWMAIKSLNSALTADEKVTNKTKFDSKKSLYPRGLALHLTNPKAILGWAAVITLSQTENGSIAVLIFTLLGSLMITFSIHFTYAAVFASKVAMDTYAKARRWIEGVLATVFGYAGLRLLTD
ncbi:MAG: LysE family translocator [Hyphomicrobiales bacterium]